MPSSGGEIHPEYAKALADIQVAKPVINFLTQLAEDYVESADSIAETIVQRAQAKPRHGLALVYLTDSILKNVGKVYTQAFVRRIVPFFSSIFARSDSKTRKSLLHVRDTWGKLFPQETLRAIDNNVRPRGSSNVGGGGSGVVGRVVGVSATKSAAANSNVGSTVPAVAARDPRARPPPMSSSSSSTATTTTVAAAAATLSGAAVLSQPQPQNQAFQLQQQQQQQQQQQVPPPGPVPVHLKQAVEALRAAETELAAGLLPPDKHKRLIQLAASLRQKIGPYAPPMPMPQRRLPPPLPPSQQQQQQYYKIQNINQQRPQQPQPQQPQPQQPTRALLPPAPSTAISASTAAAAAPTADSVFQKLLLSGLIAAPTATTTATQGQQEQTSSSSATTASTTSATGTSTSTTTSSSASSSSSALSGTPAPPALLTADALKLCIPHYVRALYENQPCQCRYCGRRFGVHRRLQLNEHLDWHFRRNRDIKAKGGRKVRGWLLSKTDWIAYTGVESVENRIKSSVFDADAASHNDTDGTNRSGGGGGGGGGGKNGPNIPYGTNGISGGGGGGGVGDASSCTVLADGTDVCALCGEKFDTVYLDEEEEWHYVRATKYPSGIFHVSCYSDTATNAPGSGGGGGGEDVGDDGSNAKVVPPPAKKMKT
eukprot:UC1_evm5s1820